MKFITDMHPAFRVQIPVESHLCDAFETHDNPSFSRKKGLEGIPQRKALIGNTQHTLPHKNQ